ncbi:MAG TPA: tripartite tricarboxylate transporter substrate-binding protein [Xanthobacteraceae bacterium]|jgi:tripartite-type tricarboxylate transporter receptor subunit TctC
MGKKVLAALTLASVIAFGLRPPPTLADPVEDFYRGKTVTFVIGSGEAGLYDLGGRLIARHLARYIPGHPTMVPQNMPGASSVRAASYIYNLAPRDGSVLGTVQPTIVLNKLLDPTAPYEPKSYTWIGRLQPVTLVGIAWTAAADNTMADARERKLIVSGSGASGTSAMVPWALNRLAGTHFHVVTGYQSAIPQLLAMERGEVEGVGSASLSDVLARPDWIKSGKINFLYAIAARRSAQLPQVPALTEFAQNELGRSVLGLLGSVTDIGFTIMAPPGVPAERAASLRKAFRDMVRDPDFLSEASRIGLDPEPQSGEELQSLIAETLGATGQAMQKLREVTQPPR